MGVETKKDKREKRVMHVIHELDFWLGGANALHQPEVYHRHPRRVQDVQEQQRFRTFVLLLLL